MTAGTNPTAVEVTARKVVERWLLLCDGTQVLGFVQSEFLQQCIAQELVKRRQTFIPEN